MTVNKIIGLLHFIELFKNISKVVHNQLINFIENYNKFTISQFGFQKINVQN